MHPNDSTKLEEQWPILDELARDATCVAIGETGLDWFRDHVDRASRHGVFGVGRVWWTTNKGAINVGGGWVQRGRSG